MEDILVKYEAYSGYAFKGLDSDKDVYGIEQLLLEDVHGIKGKIKYTGSEAKNTGAACRMKSCDRRRLRALPSVDAQCRSWFPHNESHTPRPVAAAAAPDAARWTGPS